MSNKPNKQASEAGQVKLADSKTDILGRIICFKMMNIIIFMSLDITIETMYL